MSSLGEKEEETNKQLDKSEFSDDLRDEPQTEEKWEPKVDFKMAQNMTAKNKGELEVPLVVNVEKIVKENMKSLVSMIDSP